MKNISKIIIPVMILMVFVLPVFVLAADPIESTGTPPPIESVDTPSPVSFQFKIDNPLNSPSIEALITTVIDDILIPIGGVIAVIMIIYAGFMYVTARGDTGKIKTAHDALLYGVIGAAILLGAKVIATVIENTINQLG